MRRTLYIHIGNHKTGTTSLQAALAGSAPLLAAHTYRYFHGPFAPSSPKEASVHSWLRLHGASGEGPGMREPERLADILSETDENCIISSEIFSMINSSLEISRIKDAFSAQFEAIKIIAYIRRQDLQAISHKKQAARRVSVYARHIWGSSINPIPDITPTVRAYLDYNLRLGKWADIFGDENMIIRIYEKAALARENTVADMFNILGLPMSEQKLEANASLSDAKTILRHSIHAMNATNIERLHKILDDMDDLPGIEWTPSQAEAEAFYGHFADANAALNARFGLRSEIADIFEKDFEARYGETAFQWRHEDVAALLQALLGALDKRVKPLGPRDAARSKAVQQHNA